MKIRLKQRDIYLTMHVRKTEPWSYKVYSYATTLSIQKNDIKQNGICQNDTRQNDIKYNNAQQNYTLQKGI